MEQQEKPLEEENGGSSSAPPHVSHDTPPPPPPEHPLEDFLVAYLAKHGNRFHQFRESLARTQNLPVPTGLEGTSFCLDHDSIVESRRRGRKTFSQIFRGEYTYNTDGYNNINDVKTCIWSECKFSWSDKSFGIPWVGLHGKDSICVVTMSEDLDMTRVCGKAKRWDKHIILRDFRKSAISDIDDLVDPSSTLRKSLDQSIKSPFGVVSVVPSTDKSPQESGHEAINFLKKELETDKVFDVYETIETAISAFQYLCGNKVKAKDIGVSVMDPEYWVTIYEDKDPTIEEVPLWRVEVYLAQINQEYVLEEEDDDIKDPLLKKMKSDVPNIKAAATTSETTDEDIKDPPLKKMKSSAPDLKATTTSETMD